MSEYHNHSEAEIQDILQTIIDPFSGVGLLENKALTTLKVKADSIELVLQKSYPVEYAKNLLEVLLSLIHI